MTSWHSAARAALWNWQLHAVLLWRAECLGAGGVAPELVFYRLQKVTSSIGILQADTLFETGSSMLCCCGEPFGCRRRGSKASFLEASESDVRHWHPAGRHLLKLAASCCFAVASRLFGSAEGSGRKNWHLGGLSTEMVSHITNIASI